MRPQWESYSHFSHKQNQFLLSESIYPVNPNSEYKSLLPFLEQRRLNKDLLK